MSHLRQAQKKCNKKRTERTAGMLMSLMAAMAVLLSGCTESPKAPTPAPGPAAPKAQPQPITPIQPKPEAPKAEEKPAPAYSYNPGGRRDPFKPLISREEKKAKVADRPPLERYNISEFKLTGIVWGGFGYNAMLEGPDGKGYFVRVGTIMGPNRGVIKKITKSSIVIEEKYKTYTGQTQHKEIIVDLRKKQEGTP